MSRLTDLLQNVSKLDPTLGTELTREFQELMNSRNYGLVFEKHQPEAVELPLARPSRGSTVRLLPPRGEYQSSEADQRLWTVVDIKGTLDGEKYRRYDLLELGAPSNDRQVLNNISADDVVVVSAFQDSIYPGLVETSSVIFPEGMEKPAHVVINAENYHALQLLTYTSRHSIDAIYIDPPYNTGAKDWKYNNDYVGVDDGYRHSKWLSFMERRLKLAKQLLNPADSVLIVTIDEKEYLRLGLLLEQVFPEGRIQMVSSVINPSGSQRAKSFWRTDEYVFFVMLGEAGPTRWISDMTAAPDKAKQKGVIWNSLRRRGSNNLRTDRPGCFYPIYVSNGRIVEIGEVLPEGQEPGDEPEVQGANAIYPIKPDGNQGRNELTPDSARKLHARGLLRARETRNGLVIQYLRSSEIRKVESGQITTVGVLEDGSLDLQWNESVLSEFAPKSHWSMPSHNSDTSGTKIVRALMPDRRFPFPKSLYAVEDALRFFVKDKPEATVLDFFSGSGTTAHAVMRLNKQDNGRRRSISITNNEVSADEQVKLRKQGLRPGDPDWEKWGICDYITKPRITAAITGITPEGEPVKGDYKFTDEFPMSEGFPENARFYTLNYLSPNVVTAGRVFQSVAPMLWLAAGQQGRVIEDLGDQGWDVTNYYGVIEEMDNLREFVEAVNATPHCRTVFIVTDDDGAFELAAQAVRDDMKTYRLYESYLSNFEIVNR